MSESQGRPPPPLTDEEWRALAICDEPARFLARYLTSNPRGTYEASIGSVLERSTGVSRQRVVELVDKLRAHRLVAVDADPYAGNWQLLPPWPNSGADFSLTTDEGKAALQARRSALPPAG